MPPRTITPLDATDTESARLFGVWLRDHDVTLEELSSETGVGRSTLAALSRPAGGAAQTRWSAIRRPTLESIHAAVQQRQPMALRELGELLRVDMTARPDTWADVAAWAGARAGAVTVMGVTLAASWDYRAPESPHVVQGPSGELAVVSELPAGWIRLGRLIALTPV